MCPYDLLRAGKFEVFVSVLAKRILREREKGKSM